MSGEDTSSEDHGNAGNLETRIVLRPLGMPLPLGFLGLLVATVGFSALQLGWLAPDQGHVIALGVLALTVPLQLLACVFGFFARDPVAGTGMGVLAGTWAVTALATLTSPPGATSPGLGTLLVAASIAMVVPVVAAGTKVAAATVMSLTAARFAITGVAEITGSTAWLTTAGVAGLVLAGAAVYAALAFEIEGARDRTVLPVGRRGAGADALSGRMDVNLQELAREAGVRRHL